MSCLVTKPQDAAIVPGATRLALCSLQLSSKQLLLPLMAGQGGSARAAIQCLGLVRAQVRPVSQTAWALALVHPRGWLPGAPGLPLV